MKKLLFLFMLMLLILSCGKGKEGKMENERIQAEIALEKEEAEKYRSHLNFYNYILKVDEGIRYYFETEGMNKKSKKPKKVNSIPQLSQNIIDEMKVNIGKNGKMEEVDNAAKEVIPALSEIKTVTDEMQQYYKSQAYLNDKYRKGNELHIKFLEISRKYMQVSKNYKEVFERQAEKQKEKKTAEIKEKGEVIKYNMTVFMDSCEDFLDEIERQKLDFSSYMSEGKKERFIQLEGSISAAYGEFEKSVNDSVLLKEEGYVNSDFTSFELYSRRVRASIAKFIEKVGSRPKGRKSKRNSVLAKDEPGTPEHIFNEYNSVVSEYNKLLKK